MDDQLKKLHSYLEREGLYAEAGYIQDLADKAKKKTKKHVKKFWKKNRKSIARASLFFALGFMGRDYLDDNSITDQTIQWIDGVFDSLAPNDYESHLVQEGESVWQIAESFYPNSVEQGAALIIEENNLGADGNINPGQILRIPKVEAIFKAVQSAPEVETTSDESTDKAPSVGERSASDQLVELIKRAEGSSKSKGAVPAGGRIHSTGYHKGTDHTIGYGHALTNQEKKKAGLATGGKDRNGNPLWASIYGVNITYHPDWKGITDQEATQILRGDLKRFEDMINKKGFNLNQHQFDALLHFIYNVGSVPSSITKLIKSNQHDKVPDKMREYVYAGGKKSKGLANRRENEAAIWTDGNYDL